MIEKIEIKDIATYTNETLDNLSKVNFVYGNNGSGKTTISRIIREESKFPTCNIKWKDNTRLETLVYNSDFVEENFQPSQEIKGIFTLGKEESDTQKRINEEKKFIDDTQKKIDELTNALSENNDKTETQIATSKNKFWKIKQKFDNEKSPLISAITGARGKVDTFFDRVLKENETNKAELKTKAELEKNAKQCYESCVEPITPISNISYSEIEIIESNKILDKPIVGKEDLDIAALIKTLNNSDWVKTGMKYVSLANKKCPFCQQTLPANLEERLNDYFDETYENDKNTVLKLQRDYSNAINIYLGKVNSLLSSSYEQLNKDELKSAFSSIQKIIDSNLNNINKKLENLSQKIELKSILEYCKEIDSIILEANNKIDEHNKFIQNIKSEKQKLEPLVWKYICNELKDDIKEYSDNIGILKTEKTELESEKIEKDIELSEHENILTEFEKKQTSVKPTLDSINKLLSDFNFTGFRLAQGDSEYTYKIERLDGMPVEKTLSEGEKSFVAFLYFYNLLNGSQSSSGVVNNRIVVIDDPVSSLDNDILFIVSTLIRMLFKGLFDNSISIKQLIVLTHNLYFFKEVSFDCGLNKSEKNKLRFWTINKVSNNSHIKAYEKNNPIKTSYELLWDIIRQTENDKSKYDCIYLQNTMRRILEYYFKMLGNKPVRDRIDEFEVYERPIYKALISWVNIGSHSQMEEIFYNERTETNTEIFLSVFKKIFERTNQIAHYNMMMKIETDKESN
ncbi:MAG: AAA family ATPase [Treponema sp.]|nr:AAA family ATPase [Treponema sp.]